MLLAHTEIKAPCWCPSGVHGAAPSLCWTESSIEWSPELIPNQAEDWQRLLCYCVLSLTCRTTTLDGDGRKHRPTGQPLSELLICADTANVSPLRYCGHLCAKNCTEKIIHFATAVKEQWNSKNAGQVGIHQIQSSTNDIKGLRYDYY